MVGVVPRGAVRRARRSGGGRRAPAQDLATVPCREHRDANDREYGRHLAEDIELRRYLKNNLYKAGISKIKIGRKANQIEIDLYTAKPGLIIGKGGREVAAIREKLFKRTGLQK